MRESKVQRMRDEALRCLADAPVDTTKWGTDVKRLLEELSIYQIELEHQVEEQRHAQDELIAVRDAYEDLFENAPLAYVVLDVNMCIQKWNKPFETIFLQTEMSERYGINEPFSRHVTETNQDAFFRFSRLLTAGSTTASTELQMVNRYGRSLAVRVNAVSNVPLGIYRFAITDLSIQKRLEAQLREKELVEKTQRGVHK